MKLVRYDHPLSAHLGDFDRFFRGPFEGFGRLFELADRLGGTPGEPRLAADLYEDDANYYSRVELPGVKKDDLTVELHDRTLTVGFERQAKNAEGKEESTVWKRTVTVPDGIDPEKVSAQLEDGVLTVTLPKSEERKPRKITVK
ncbi:MAG: Hsp20/alpha crystallin family protein [Akkermansiaceae bacterium]|nr:Hsp20/alpha crystallin family protein [Akkermansiaceae bacterium]